MSDSFNYIIAGNPLSKKIISGCTWLLRGGGGVGTSLILKNSTVSADTMSGSNSMRICWPSLSTLAGRSHYFVRLAGLSGAAAVVLGAIGSHKLSPNVDAEARNVFETANRFHFFHSIALMGTPLARYPALTGALMISGTMLFSGLLYYRAFTGNKSYAKLAPVGGTCLILAWLSLVL